MFRRVTVLVVSGALVASAWAQTGNPNDIYVTSDAHHEVYQFERNNPWNHVPGNYPGALGGTYSQVFSNPSQLQTNSPYLGAVGGPSDNFFIGGFNGLIEIDSTSGAYVRTVASGFRLGPAEAPNGNIVIGGPTGVEEYDSSNGNFVRTVNGVGDGANMYAFNGNDMYVSRWSDSGFGVQRYDFVSGAPIGATIPVPFGPQEIGFGPDGALYATALYEGAAFVGLWRYDFGAGTWSRFIDTSSLTGTGPHGFTYDPANYDIYLAFQTGEIFRFDVNGTYLNQIAFVPTKLTDILFKEVVPEPATLLLGAAGLALLLRRR
mgnify:CR=1 FL=1